LTMLEKHTPPSDLQVQKQWAIWIQRLQGLSLADLKVKSACCETETCLNTRLPAV